MIYFIADQAAARVKIGFSADPWRRFAKVQSDCPGELELLLVVEGDTADEAAFHARFALDRVRGEWFRLSTEIADFVSAQPGCERPARRGYRNTWGDSGLTDGDLEALTGVTRPQLCRIRRGKSTPSLPTAVKIVEHTGVSFEWLARAA